jgi:hypothetical protein
MNKFRAFIVSPFLWIFVNAMPMVGYGWDLKIFLSDPNNTSSPKSYGTISVIVLLICVFAVLTVRSIFQAILIATNKN